MKKIIFLLMMIATVLMFANRLNAQLNNSSSMLRHIVIITLKKDAPADSVKVLDSIYAALSKNDMVKDFEMGVNISTRDTAVVKHVYVTTFASKDDIDNYKKIPLYKQLFKTSLNVADDVSVIDYWIKK